MSRYRCEVCDYVYDEVRGEAREGFPARTPWAQIPDDWCCPDCGVREKVDFIPLDAVGGDAAPSACDDDSDVTASTTRRDGVDDATA